MRLLCSAIVAMSVAACTTDSTLTIENDSRYTFETINLAPIDQVSWGRNLLGGDVLLPGEILEVRSIDCDTYDVRIIDDLDRECILDAVDLCLDDAYWVMDNAELASCRF